jgi:hypothetical protein
MAELFDRIKAAVSEGRFVVSDHADNMLLERAITSWQVETGIAEGHLLVERPNDKPFPAIEVEQVLPDGTPVKAIWSWNRLDSMAKLVTVHFFDR